MRLEPALAGALVAAQDQVTLPTSVAGIAELFGPGKRGVAGLARALYEGGNNKTYGGALRSVERYIRTERGDIREGDKNARRPSAQTGNAMAKLAASRVDRATIRDIKREGLTVRFSGEVTVSPGGKHADARDRDIDAYIPGDEAAAFLDALMERRLDDAGDEFSAALMDAYGIGAPAVISDVESLDFFIGNDNTPL